MGRPFAFLGRLFRRRRDPADPLTSSRRDAPHPGTVLEVIDAIEHGYGKARLRDTAWTVTGGDAAIGAHVRVVRVEGTVLVVERVA